MWHWSVDAIADGELACSTARVNIQILPSASVGVEDNQQWWRTTRATTHRLCMGQLLAIKSTSERVGTSLPFLQPYL